MDSVGVISVDKAKMDKPKAPRSSGIELLRIFAMIGIVMSHLVLSSPHGQQIIQASNNHTLYLVLLQASGQIGVFIFFLITGYFMVRREFSLSGIKKVIAITWFYSALFFIFALLVGALKLNTFFSLDPGNSALTIQNALKNLLPVIQNNYWFVNAYIVILLLAPAINKVLLATKKERLALILILTSLAFYGLNFFSRLNHWGMDFEIYNNLLLYTLVYSIGAYLQLHKPEIKTQTLFLLLGIASLLYLLWRYYLVHDLHTFDIANRDTDFPPFAIAIIVFTLFLRLNIRPNKWINMIAASTFAVYVIHTNANIWHFIWKTFDVYSVFGTVWVYIYPFIIATLVFALCVSIEMLRQYLVKKFTDIIAARNTQDFTKLS